MNRPDSNALLERTTEIAPIGNNYALPTLPYDYAALEPYIDARTLKLHHDKHHASYVTNLNIALDKHPELYERTAEWLLCNLAQVPSNIRSAVHHNAGGHVNHSLYWTMMSPTGSGVSGPLADALTRNFGGFEQFKCEFDEAGEKHFGSGWVWLVRDPDNAGKLRIMTTEGHDHPMMQGCIPLLVNDVWEHAYYLKYENRRDDYLQSWWSVVHWEEVARRFDESVQ